MHMHTQHTVGKVCRTHTKHGPTVTSQLEQLLSIHRNSSYEHTHTQSISSLAS